MDSKLLAWLVEKDISFIKHEHQAVFTVPEAKIHCGHIPGTHIKNLFMKDKRTGVFYLVTIPSEKRMRLSEFRKMMKFSKIRFGTSEDLMAYLGLTPGAVSPLGLINNINNDVIFITDLTIWNADQIVAHPNINSESLEIKREDFHRLIQETGNEYKILSLPYE